MGVVLQSQETGTATTFILLLACALESVCACGFLCQHSFKRFACLHSTWGLGGGVGEKGCSCSLCFMMGAWRFAVCLSLEPVSEAGQGLSSGLIRVRMQPGQGVSTNREPLPCDNKDHLMCCWLAIPWPQHEGPKARENICLP